MWGGPPVATLRGMTRYPSPAEELRLLDAELWQLDRRRAQLLARRAWLVAAVQSAAHAASAGAASAVPPGAPASSGPHGPSGPGARARAASAPAGGPRPETGARGVQNLLLLLGGLLLTIAAAVFTLVSWGHLGITGRAAVLGVLTLAVLATPAALLGRRLRSTAEAVAGLGLALTVLDAYALHRVALPHVDGADYAAAAALLLAGAWAGYGTLPRVARPALPRPAAVVAAQFALPLWALSAEPGSAAGAAALLVTAALDAALAVRAVPGAVRLTAAVCAYTLGAWGVLSAWSVSVAADTWGHTVQATALLLFAAGVLGAVAWRGGVPAGLARGLSVAAGLVTTAAAVGALLPVTPVVWTPPLHLVCGVALLSAVRAGRLPEPVREGLLWAGAAVLGLTALGTLPLVAVVLYGPLAGLDAVWSGAPESMRAATVAGLPWPWQLAAAPLVLAVVAAVLAAAAGRLPWPAQARHAALALGWAAALVLPSVLDLPYFLGLAALGALTALALLSPWARPTAAALGLAGSAHLALAALPSRTATLVVLGALTAGLAAVSRPRPAVTLPAALGYATALACATGAAAGWAPEHTAPLVLAVPALAALMAPRLPEGARLPVEIAGMAAGLLAVGLAALDLPVLSLVLALGGVILAGTALREDRRRVAWAAAVLWVLASWVRLSAWEIGTPEAYTLPVSVPALVVGHLRLRRDPGVSSWTAYGPGLGVTLVPSLLAAWGDSGWERPLLLGMGALAVTLWGAGRGLKAPLVLGGGVLILNALHELAPYLVQLHDALPRWALPALAGLLLLTLGATYERRLRDVRRVRDVLGRMQ